jgi:hypothetical protein
LTFNSQALILAPTRELAQQIQKVARALGDFLNVSSHACVGGTLVRDDIRILREGVQIVVGTPGRVYGQETRNTQRSWTAHQQRRAKLPEESSCVSCERNVPAAYHHAHVNRTPVRLLQI